MFNWWLQTNHAGAYLFPLAQACRGNRQDGATELAGTIIGNIPIYLEFLAWQYGCGGGEGILEHNFLIIYRSINYVALLRVLEILHMIIALPLRCLAGKFEHLSKWEFGAADMPYAMDLTEKAFAKI